MRRPDVMSLIYWLCDIRDRQGLMKELYPPQRGRPPKNKRTDLIRQIWNYYPRGMADTTINGHFHVTIEMVLGFLKCRVQDIHETIINALKGWK
jgi:hypothetical protein